jgi:hypothetical protein
MQSRDKSGLILRPPPYLYRIWIGTYIQNKGIKELKSVEKHKYREIL